MQAAEEAKLLLVEERLGFEAWRDSLETVPTIKRLRSKAEAIRVQEVEKALKILGADLNKKQRKAPPSPPSPPLTLLARWCFACI